jgi:anti-anti-sigma regulatory factor
MPDTQILVAVDDQHALARVVGRGTFACAQQLRDFGSSVLSQGNRQLVIDLSECSAMDSTFMGVLAMLAQQRRGAIVSLANVDPYNAKLLSGLGIKRLFQFIVSEGTPDWATLTAAKVVEPSARQQGQTMLEAHEALMDVDPENIPRFTDVITFLKMDLDRLAEENSDGDSRF